jgi:hypothetical protein
VVIYRRRSLFALSTVQAGEDLLAGGDVPVLAAVVAGVGLYPADEFVFVVGADRLIAALAGQAYGHIVSWLLGG